MKLLVFSDKFRNFAPSNVLIINNDMDQTQNKFISVSYQLYTVEDGKDSLVEQTQQGRPFQFISGFGVSLDVFEQRMLQLNPGDKFDFTIEPADAFGEYNEKGVHKMEREAFVRDGKFDHENIYPGAIITLMDDNERRFMGRVVEIDGDGVTIDTNHPLAGETLRFTGVVLENRDATINEIQQMLNQLSHEGCGSCDEEDCEEGCGGCGGCGGCHK